MKARIVEIKYADKGTVMLVEMPEPAPPAYPSYGLDTDEEVAKFREANRTYQDRLREWERLHLGEIEFEYL